MRSGKLSENFFSTLPPYLSPTVEFYPTVYVSHKTAFFFSFFFFRPAFSPHPSSIALAFLTTPFPCCPFPPPFSFSTLSSLTSFPPPSIAIPPHSRPSIAIPPLIL